ncbi:helix-turn-helix domain-containing protein [Streptococcus ruminantium]|uniref:helix-turn-helix domain-containing protein n=1 Tax=Streptococcus ruminantium TaxID=1917441 RepID=UPI0015B61851|nr:helix-turn-helix transcriptional regulator [Streptococcus ruminantium]
MTSVPNRIKELRTQAGLTQQELASQLGVIRKTISNWERGANRISPEHTEHLAKLFKVSVSYLLGTSQDSTAPYSDLSHWVTYSTQK